MNLTELATGIDLLFISYTIYFVIVYRKLGMINSV